MKRNGLLVLIMALGFGLNAQDTLKLTRQEAEAIFLQNNLHLIAQKLHIERQQAEIIQAKLWPNPELSVNEINLWHNATVDYSPPFWGNFGQNQQVGFELSQLIQTAGKRKKLIALEQIELAKAEQYFENLLRNLKLELRQLLSELQYIQQAIQVHQNLVESISILTHAYNNQLNKGNISKSEYIRLKAQELDISKDVLELSQEAQKIQKELKLLLRIEPFTTIEISIDGFEKDTQPYTSIFVEQLIQGASENRPDYQLARLEKKYADNLLIYEKSKRVPDLRFGINYDRNGSTMLDFVGVGLTVELPIFDRRQGAIRQAEIGIEQAKVQEEQTIMLIQNEINLAYQSLLQAIAFLNRIEADYESDLDLLLENYTKNFAARNVSMLEYFDFMDAYLNNKKIILEARKDVLQKAEELNYSLGTDL